MKRKRCRKHGISEIANIYRRHRIMVRLNGNPLSHTCLDEWSASKAIIKVGVLVSSGEEISPPDYPGDEDATDPNSTGTAGPAGPLDNAMFRTNGNRPSEMAPIRSRRSTGFR